MRTRLARINQTMQRVKVQIGQALLARLPLALQRYAQDGERPGDELGQSYIDLTESAMAVMDQSVGGPDHGRACEQYEASLGEWKIALRAAGL